MESSLISKVLLSNEHYRKIAIDTFEEYIRLELKDSLLWDAIHIDFEDWTKENRQAINVNGMTCNIIKKRRITMETNIFGLSYL